MFGTCKFYNVFIKFEHHITFAVKIIKKKNKQVRLLCTCVYMCKYVGFVCSIADVFYWKFRKFYTFTYNTQVCLSLCFCVHTHENMQCTFM